MVLAVVAQSALLVGVLASVAGLLTPHRLHRRRRLCWLVATVGFAISGVLGILSIGILLLVFAGATAQAALRAAAGAGDGGARGLRDG